MRAPALLLLLAATALGLGAAGGGSAVAARTARRATCARAHSQTLASSAAARVFLVYGRDDDLYGPPATVFGCLRRHPRPVVLQRFAAGDAPTVTGRRLAGRYAALAETVVSVACSKYMGDAPECTTFRFASWDLTTGRVRATGRAPVAAFVLSSHGWLAWTTPPDPLGLTDVVAVTATGTRTLDRGAVDAGSLRLAGSLLSWTRAGAPQSATLP